MSELLQQQIVDKKQKLKDLNIIIAERADYFNTQEALINELIEKGNDELLMLSHEIALAKKELREIKTDIRTSSQDKVLLMEDLRGLQVQVATLVVI